MRLCLFVCTSVHNMYVCLWLNHTKTTKPLLIKFSRQLLLIYLLGMTFAYFRLNIFFLLDDDLFSDVTACQINAFYS